jgi:hypothetical protein
MSCTDRFNGPYTLIHLPRSVVVLLFTVAPQLPSPYCCVPDPLRPLLMHAGSPSLIVACKRPLHPCWHNNCLIVCTLYPILAFSLVFYLELFLRLKDGVYCCLALALGAHTVDSSATDLVYINRDCLCHLRVQRRQAKLTQEHRTYPQLDKRTLSAAHEALATQWGIVEKLPQWHNPPCLQKQPRIG